MTERTRQPSLARASDGRLVGRPLSPHLQVYRPQITSALSIFHRVAGCAVSVGTLLLVWWLVSAASSDAAFASVQAFIGSPIGLLILFGWTVALIYHFANGIRHLFWDAGYGFSLPSVHASGRAVIVATCGLTVLVWVVGLAIR